MSHRCWKRGAMGIASPTVGQKAAPEGLEPVIRSMVEALEQAAGLRPGQDRLDLSHPGNPLGAGRCRWSPSPAAWPTASTRPQVTGRPTAISRAAGTAIAASPAFQGAGALPRGGDHPGHGGGGGEPLHRAVRLHHLPGHRLPLKNPPILKLTGRRSGAPPPWAQCIRDKLGWFADEGGLSPLALGPAGEGNPSYARVDELARGIAGGWNPCSPRDRPRGAGGRPTRPRCWVRPWPRGWRASPLPGQRGVDNGDYIDIGARGGRRGITGCHQDAGIQQIVTAKERSHDTQKQSCWGTCTSLSR